MRTIYGLAALAVVTMPVSASATTYIGSLTGVITSGTETYDSLADGYFQNDLTGKAITIDFTSDVTYNYQPNPYDFYTRYVVNTFNVSIPGAAVFPSAGGTISNDYFLSGQSADFIGNANAAAFSASGSVRYPEPDFSQSLSFSFANASSTSGPLTGSGTSYVLNYYPFGATYFIEDVSFRLTSGFVTASGVPEPATWAMMIIGFGAAGVAMRKRQQVTVAYA